MDTKVKRHGKSIAREHAMQGLYTYALTQKMSMVEVNDKLAMTMVENTVLNITELDKQISKYLKKWTISELNPVVLSILRLSVYELSYETTPPKVVINEALELAKKYADNNAKNFVHSVLDSIVKTNE